ncbi:4-hydroxythreonine-4-phosphate dehydrogenase PdxA [Altererythrobacter sp.]|uniref:4-hydroxythreonine-4-phosphate dehydrogenase PdxA n=1 Tax=Altererythrobacter sp. TaxID=1872480 RepID=UPI001B016AA6|nr:4-hydroxythreonine-4-phosphate dehydrogenase PdxA [Altererythrobacter sp.]MBO6642869.1 4-hydroxythreonine-4-phosphate dehydrogenase PdxA [Altererythrobacter sp.]MBO6709612.1 4-hydroxythreonine-4-phosphate dehydrogenase PdxA [Altererythrobacter sp.]MBO6944079.1 4-hydroxythreonine-4-phosphate dehydrogenase PdxA [Altererythrobacter sp.]
MSNAGKPPPIAVSLGDPAGIGPEIIVRAWLMRAEAGLPPFAVTSGADILRGAAAKLGVDCSIAEIGSIGEASTVCNSALAVLGDSGVSYRPGSPDIDGAQLALQSLTQATHLAVNGEASALVTAPIAKKLLEAVGFEQPGQTEFLAVACGLPADASVMMLAGPNLRAVPLTVHCSLAEVPGLLSVDLIASRGRIVVAALQRYFGVEKPRLAVTGLNPHAGEDGKFGSEDQDIIAPAIRQLVNEGIDATGPHPADALFSPHSRGGFDVALCMYHDQALIPVKALDFDQGVNVTLGLPIIRTSPDHGTAFDIAGQGIANPGAMIAAIRMAGEMVERRNHGA